MDYHFSLAEGRVFLNVTFISGEAKEDHLELPMGMPPSHPHPPFPTVKHRPTYRLNSCLPTQLCQHMVWTLARQAYTSRVLPGELKKTKSKYSSRQALLAQAVPEGRPSRPAHRMNTCSTWHPLGCSSLWSALVTPSPQKAASLPVPSEL